MAINKRYRIIALILLALCQCTCAQNTLVLEKIGSPRRFYYHSGDYIKLRTKSGNLLIRDRIFGIGDSALSVPSVRSAIHLHDIESLYRVYQFPRKLAINLGGAAVMYFLVISFDNLINKDRVLTPYTYIISGACIAGGLISFSLSQYRYPIGLHWKLKVLDYSFR